MKTRTLVCSALAASMAFATVAQAQPQHEWRGDRGHAQQQQRQWRGHDRGEQRWQHPRQQQWQAPAYPQRNHAPRYYGGQVYNNYAPRSYAYGGSYGAPRPYYGPSYSVGGYAPAYVAQRYWVNDWRARHLYAPPYGYQWVQTDAGDVLLVALATGLIANAILAAH